MKVNETTSKPQHPTLLETLSKRKSQDELWLLALQFWHFFLLKVSEYLAAAAEGVS